MARKPTLPFPEEGESHVDLFRKKEVRKVFHENEWWFSIKDVLEAVVETPDGTRYAADLRKRDPGLNARYSEISRTLPFRSEGGVQNTTFVNIEGVFRLMQSVPNVKAEPFKRWLAKVGFERLQEVQNPELAIKRAITLYRVQGYDDEWIDARIRNKTSRELITGEWGRRGMSKYIGLLTDAISKGTFGLSTTEHKQIKNLKSQSLRDNMTPIELTLTTLGEQATHEIIKTTNPTSVQHHINVADQGGRIAGSARKNIESATRRSVISKENYLTTKQRELNAQKNQQLNEIMGRLLKKPEQGPATK